MHVMRVFKITLHTCCMHVLCVCVFACVCSHVCVVCTCCVCVCCVCVVTHARNESVYNFFAQLAMSGVAWAW